MLELKNISVSYGKFVAVKNVTACFDPGSLSLISGHHGAGKSSLLRAIIGLSKSLGDVKLESITYRNRTPNKMMKAGMALVPEGRSIFPKLTVKENLKFGLIVGQNVTEITNDDLFFPQIENLLDKKAFTLSGGQAQMLSILIGLMTKPKYLLLDQPFAGLSSEPAALLSGKIQQLAHRSDMTIIIAGEKNYLPLSCISQEIELINGETRK